MCGIVGYIEPRTEPFRPWIIEKMSQTVQHRGPDGAGMWHGESGDWRSVLGHRRLSIIDIEGGTQPMCKETHHITFNGEIFNYRDLKTKLETLGTTFHTRSDTEVLLNHLIRFGMDGLGRLNGMFAFALWDETNQSLLLARDRAGIKPLYYGTTQDGGIVFGSELRAILAHPKIINIMNPQAVMAYLHHDYVPAPLSIVSNVCKVEPGTAVVWKSGTISKPKSYWKISLAQMNTESDQKTLVEELRTLLQTAVTRQLESDVPVGVFLSGGLDSSIIAALASRARTTETLTFSIGFKNETYDESSFARSMSEHIGSRHFEHIIDEGTIHSRVGEIIDSLDEPNADHSYIPTYLLSEMAARHVKVVLGGDGGDELWAGYPSYKAHIWADRYLSLPHQFQYCISRMVQSLKVNDSYQSLEWKLKRFVSRSEKDPIARHMRWMAGTDTKELSAIIKSRPVYPAIPQSSDQLNRLLALDFMTYLPGSVLTKVDRASMNHGLETRPPFLDNDVIDFAFHLPSVWKLNPHGSKYLLKKAAVGLIPNSIIHRRKQGFSIPLASWLRRPLKKFAIEAFRDSPLWEAGLLNRIELKDRWDEHSLLKKDHAKLIWSLIILDRWAKSANIDLPHTTPLEEITHAF